MSNYVINCAERSLEQFQFQVKYANFNCTERARISYHMGALLFGDWNVTWMLAVGCFLKIQRFFYGRKSRMPRDRHALMRINRGHTQIENLTMVSN